MRKIIPKKNSAIINLLKIILFNFFYFFIFFSAKSKKYIAIGNKRKNAIGTSNVKKSPKKAKPKKIPSKINIIPINLHK